MQRSCGWCNSASRATEMGLLPGVLLTPPKTLQLVLGWYEQRRGRVHGGKEGIGYNICVSFPLATILQVQPEAPSAPPASDPDSLMSMLG